MTAAAGEGRCEARPKPKYREIIAKLPEFDKRDRFEMNIVNCAMLAAFILCMPQRPDIETLTDYYAAAMMTPADEGWFCRASGKKKFTRQGHRGHEGDGEAARGATATPIRGTWTFSSIADGSGYEARFTTLRHLHADAGVGALRSDARAVPSGLHDERRGRRVGFRAASTRSPPAGRTATAATSGNLPRSTDQIAEKLGAFFKKNVGSALAFSNVLCYILDTEKCSDSVRFLKI